MKHAKAFQVGIIIILCASAIWAVTNLGSGERLIADHLSIKLAVLAPVSVTIPDGSGSTVSGVATYTISTPSRAANFITCADTDGCRLYVAETAITNGQIFEAVNVSANSTAVLDVSGVRELSGTATLGQWDYLKMIYVTDRWVQVSPESDN